MSVFVFVFVHVIVIVLIFSIFTMISKMFSDTLRLLSTFYVASKVPNFPFLLPVTLCCTFLLVNLRWEELYRSLAHFIFQGGNSKPGTTLSLSIMFHIENTPS